MFQSGLVDEVTGLLDRYGELGRTAAQAVGYREVIEFLRDGQALGSTIEQVQARTRQFARRQETWFRNLAECEFISVNAELEPKEIAQQIAG